MIARGLRSFRRSLHIHTKMSASLPREPLLAIMGTTGTGKSDLAIELALRFNGEIINADAMQMYKGLPVITNQATPEEQRGVSHHMLAVIDVKDPTWHVSFFFKEATKLIREIRGRGKLPIVVGGTHYYIHSLLFDNRLVQLSEGLPDDEPTYEDNVRTLDSNSILDGPTDLILRRLYEIDPVMAARWHPDDRRKIRRSLEIFLTTGRKASDIYEEQRRAQDHSSIPSQPWEALMFWVYTKPDALRPRLDKRVDKMESRGLEAEVRDLHSYLRDKTESGEQVDLTRGIWQSIGFKQLEPYLNAERESDSSVEDLQKLRNQALEDVKTATRQYARSQLKWLRNKTLPALRENNALDHLYLLDSSESTHFPAHVLEPAFQVTENFLAGIHRPTPSSLSETADEVLRPLYQAVAEPKPQFQTFYCEVCDATLVNEVVWEGHLKGRRHKRFLRHKRRTSLVVVEEEEDKARRSTALVKFDGDDDGGGDVGG